MRFTYASLLGIVFSMLVISCQNDPKQSDSAMPTSIDDIQLPDKQEDPVGYWDTKLIKLQSDKEGYLKSSHKINAIDGQVDPTPISAIRKDGKLLMVAVGNHDENGEIGSRTDFYFENEHLAYVKDDKEKLYIRGNDIYLWLDADRQELERNENEKTEKLNALNARLMEITNAVGIKLPRDKE